MASQLVSSGAWFKFQCRLLIGRSCRIAHRAWTATTPGMMCGIITIKPLLQMSRISRRPDYEEAHHIFYRGGGSDFPSPPAGAGLYSITSRSIVGELSTQKRRRR